MLRLGEMLAFAFVKGKLSRDAQACHFGALVGGGAMDVVSTGQSTAQLLWKGQAIRSRYRLDQSTFYDDTFTTKYKMMMFNLEIFVGQVSAYSGLYVLCTAAVKWSQIVVEPDTLVTMPQS